MCIQNNEKIFQCNSPLNKNNSGADTYIEELCGEVAAKPWKIDLAGKPVIKFGPQMLTLTIFYFWCEAQWLSMAFSGLKTSAVKY